MGRRASLAGADGSAPSTCPAPQMLPSLNLRQPIRDTDETVYCLNFSPDSQMIAAGLGDGSTQLYNVASGRRLFRLVGGADRPGPTTACAFRPGTKPGEPQVLLAIQSNGYIGHYNTSRGQMLAGRQTETEIYTCKYNVDGSAFATAGRDAVLRVFDEQTQKVMIEMKDGDGQHCAGHSNRVYSVVYSPDNYNVLFSGGWDHTVQIWDMRVGHAVNSIHDCHVYGDSLDVKEQTLLVGNFSVENQLKLFDIRNLMEPMLVQSHTFEEKAKPSRHVEEIDAKMLQTLNQEVVDQLHETKEGDDPDAPNARDIPEPRSPQDDSILSPKPIPMDLQGLQATPFAEEPEPTTLYDAKFGRTKDTYFGCGSGGKEVRVFKNGTASGSWIAPAACYCAAVTHEGRFGAVAGNGFGIQVFSLE